MEEEIWKDIEGYEGIYQVSNKGDVFSLKAGRILAPSVNNSGYKIIHLRKNAVDKVFTIHRLVAKTFVPNTLNMPEINHLNENKLDNRAENLEWCTRKYNQEYSGNIQKWVRAGSMGNKLKSSKAVYQFTLSGDFIKRWFSAREAEAELHIPRQSIGKCCLGKYKQAGGFLWSFTSAI